MRIKVSYVAEYVFDFGCVPELLRRFDSLVKNTEFDGIPPTVSFPNYEAANYVAVKLLTLLGESDIGTETINHSMYISAEDAKKLRQDGFYPDSDNRVFVCQAYSVQPTKGKNGVRLDYIGKGKFTKRTEHTVSVEHEGVICYGTKVEYMYTTLPQVSVYSPYLTIVRRERTSINLEHS